jgi:archaellum biogenesis protein FlaJ (TadC family)
VCCSSMLLQYCCNVVAMLRKRGKKERKKRKKKVKEKKKKRRKRKKNSTDLIFSSSLFISATYLIEMETSTPGGMFPTLARKISGLAIEHQKKREEEKKEERRKSQTGTTFVKNQSIQFSQSVRSIQSGSQPINQSGPVKSVYS